jgi:hypothetical protein
MEDVIKKKYESKKKSKFTDEIHVLQKKIETQEIVIQEMYNYMKLFSKCNVMNSSNQINNSPSCECNPINLYFRAVENDDGTVTFIFLRDETIQVTFGNGCINIS